MFAKKQPTENYLGCFALDLLTTFFCFFILPIERCQLFEIRIGLFLGTIELGAESNFTRDQFLGEVIALTLQSQVGLP